MRDSHISFSRCRGVPSSRMEVFAIALVCILFPLGIIGGVCPSAPPSLALKWLIYSSKDVAFFAKEIYICYCAILYIFLEVEGMGMKKKPSLSKSRTRLFFRKPISDTNPSSFLNQHLVCSYRSCIDWAFYCSSMMKKNQVTGTVCPCCRCPAEHIFKNWGVLLNDFS